MSPQAHNRKPLLGAHVSAQGGYGLALERGEKLGAEVVQIFVSSPRTWGVKIPEKDTLKPFFEIRKKSLVKEVYVHGTYLINLGSIDKSIFEKSKQTLEDEYRVANMIEAKGLIFHVGSSKGNDSFPLEQVVKALKVVLKNVQGDTKLVLENAAGGGEKIGSRLEELALIMEGVDSPRLKICLDTAHTFEAGLIAAYTPKEIDSFLETFQKRIGLTHLVALHVNDSKTVFNSHHDRHENLGKGYIGLSGFKSLAKEKRLWDKAWMLEVPGFDNQGPDKKNLDILRSCFS